MKKIKIDMYEVQLGSAMLLQFHCPDNKWVSVLADAGISASNYSEDHVNNKLPSTLLTKFNDKFRIDLIIGTHYDKDHLSGLVPIIENNNIDIGEAWLPPVANDTELHALNESLDEDDFLVNQFVEDDGIQKLQRYVGKKHKLCRDISSLIAISKNDDSDFFENNNERFLMDYRERFEQEEPFEQWMNVFNIYLNEANSVLKSQDDSHGTDIDSILDEQEEKDFYEGSFFYKRMQGWWLFDEELEFKDSFKQRWSRANELKRRDAYSLASIQRSAAKDAINATSLFKVVVALKKRNIPIRCRIIDDGQPRRFVWKSAKQQFIPSEKMKSDGPILTLLGPSEGLVKKHWHRLPVGEYMMKLAYMDIPIKGITPSNQLSYVVRFEHEEQGILVTGDAGFVDFKPGRKKYFPKLINALLPLNVVQVAHHGGRNAHFYRVLLEADYANQEVGSFLLLSHATDDRHRPSAEFGKFIAKIRTDDDVISLLFTSKPKREKVKDYIDLIHPIEPSGNFQEDVGDVCMEYSTNSGWKVITHAIEVV